MTNWSAAKGLEPFDLTERGQHVNGYGECFAPGLPRAIAQRELTTLAANLGWDASQLQLASVRQDEGPGNALLVTLVYEHLSEVFTRFGEKGVGAEKVAEALVSDVQRYQQATAALGPHLADQWTLPLALAVWKRQREATFSCTEITSHARTNFDVIERFLPVTFSMTSSEADCRVTVAPATPLRAAQ